MSSRWRWEKTTKAVVKTAKRGVKTVAKVEGSRGSLVITYEIQAFPGVVSDSQPDKQHLSCRAGRDPSIRIVEGKYLCWTLP